jgi:4-amino-4-deoxy-L-arabinose transferase-like glycosyltransferase
VKHFKGKSHGGLPAKAVPVLSGAVLAGLFAALYLGTLAPTVLYHDYPDMFDPAMLQAAAPVLGIAHPTGYPTYMMLAHLFTYLPVGDEAYRVNLISAVFGAVAVVLVYLVGLRMTRRVVAATTGALAFGLTPIFWSQAVIAEVYTVNATFIAGVLYVLLLWRDTRLDRYLLLAALLMGLSLTHHLTSALLIPAALLFVYLTDRSLLRRAGLWARGLGLFVLGLVPYLYLPLRAAMEAPLNEADPSTPERFLLLVSGGSFLLKNLLDITGSEEPGGSTGDSQMALWPEVTSAAVGILERLSPTGEYVVGQFPVLILAAGVVGIFQLISTDRAAAALLGLLFASWLVHALTYTVSDFYVFFIPAYLIFGLFVGCGVGLALREAEALARRWPARAGTALVAGVCVVAVIFPLARAPETYAEEDRSDDYHGRVILDTVASQAETGATVLHHRSSLWYMVLVQERRQDLTLVDPFETSWVRQTDFVWPDDLDAEESTERYGTGDVTGVKTARIAAERGPVYLLNQEVDGMGDFQEAGFRVEPVDENEVLYELVPNAETQAGRAA